MRLRTHHSLAQISVLQTGVGSSGAGSGRWKNISYPSMAIRGTTIVTPTACTDCPPSQIHILDNLLDALLERLSGLGWFWKRFYLFDGRVHPVVVSLTAQIQFSSLRC